MTLLRSLQGIFPMTSYFFVPKKMNAPQWLMMGSCFAIDPDKFAGPRSKQFSHCFLTAAHTMGPWRIHPQITIPEEYRRHRFVQGKVMMYDEFGNIDTAKTVEVSLSAVHPTLDVALLTIPNADEAQRFDKLAKANELNQFKSLGTSARGDVLYLNGFRGRGSFGQVTGEEDIERMKRLTEAERAKVEREMSRAVGQQDPVSTTLVALNDHQGVVTHGKVGAGMSGAPCLLRSDVSVAVGILCSAVPLKELPVGDKPDPTKQYISFVPMAPIAQWLDELWSKPLPESEKKPVTAFPKVV